MEIVNIVHYKSLIYSEMLDIRPSVTMHVDSDCYKRTTFVGEQQLAICNSVALRIRLGIFHFIRKFTELVESLGFD